MKQSKHKRRSSSCRFAGVVGWRGKAGGIVRRAAQQKGSSSASLPLDGRDADDAGTISRIPDRNRRGQMQGGVAGYKIEVVLDSGTGDSRPI